MSKQKPVELVETQTSPQALIVGDCFVKDYLSSILKDRGCQVTSSDQYSPSLLRFDYIFQFGNFLEVERGLANHLKSSGKFLFIEEKNEEIRGKEKVKILRIGDPLLWEKKDLTEKILKTIFSSTKANIIDLRKRSRPEVRPSLPKKEIHKESQKREKYRAYIEERKHLPGKKIFIGLIILIFLFFCISGGILSWYFNSLKYTFSSFRSHLSSSNWAALVDDIKEGKRKISPLKTLSDTSLSILPLLEEITFIRETKKLLDATDELLSTSDDLMKFIKASSFGTTSIFSHTSSISPQEFSSLKYKLSYFKKVVVASRAEIEKIKSPLFPKESFATFLTLASEKIVSIDELFPLLERYLTTREKRTYLILFQNNMELRPTGGFIGSFALLTLEDGRVLDFKIEDVYTADGQLKGHIDPPTPLRKYLAQPHFFLRDSNFDPDFAASAARASWFLEKELGVRVDGVIGVNLTFAQKLLRLLGSITLSDFGNEEITPDNFFFKANFFSRASFFPGSTRKKDFLTAVANAMITKFDFEKEKIAWLEIFSTIKQSLEEKNILLYDNKEDWQKMIEERGFGGRMLEVKCASLEKDNCFPDYLSLIEANLGVNKANYFVSKTVVVEKKLSSSGQLTNTITLSYENTGVRGISQEENYVNYLRLFVPKGSQLLGVTINNAPLSPLEVDIESYGADKTVFGFLVKIAPENKGVVKVNYLLSENFFSNKNSYQFFYQKQGGDKTSALVLSITYPSQLTIKPENFTPISKKEGEIYFTTDTSVDRIFAFKKISQ